MQAEKINKFSEVSISGVTVNGLPGFAYRPGRIGPHSQIFIIFYGGSREKNEGRSKVYRLFSSDLTEAGHFVYCFDYRSNLVGNKFQNFGLWDRLQDARSITNSIKLIADTKRLPLSIIGLSMGGYIAVDIAANQPNIKNLILIAPGAYNDLACQPNVKFNREFTKLIRGYYTDSGLLYKILKIMWHLFFATWRKSEIFEMAKRATANVLMIRYGKDEIISPRITERYKKAFIQRTYGHFREKVFSNFSHSGNLKDTLKRHEIVGEILDFI